MARKIIVPFAFSRISNFTRRKEKVGSGLKEEAKTPRDGHSENHFQSKKTKKFISKRTKLTKIQKKSTFRKSVTLFFLKI